MDEIIKDLITELSNDPFNPVLSTTIAYEYEKIGQTASAVSFYLRTAEYGYHTHPEHVYVSLLRSSDCFEGQKNRTNTVLNLILKAIAYFPNRPEAWFKLSQYYERNKKWQESYTAAEVGLTFSRNRIAPLPLSVEYLGEYVLTFQKAVAAWWVGRKDESKELLEALSKMDIAPMYAQAVARNLKQTGDV
jgi:tetratricopeptide (TPR) repeat protein